MKALFVVIALLISVSASAQSEKLFFRASMVKAYPIGTKGKHAPFTDDKTLFVMKSREVRVNDGKQWKDVVYQVATITTVKKMVWSWVCVDRVVTVDIRNQTLTITPTSGMSLTYKGTVYNLEPRDFRTALPAPSRTVVLDSIVH